MRLTSLTENYLGSTRALLRTLFAAVLLFLLISCANVTSVQLVRAAARRQAVTGVVVAVAFVASYLPARRAARLDPQLALKAG